MVFCAKTSIDDAYLLSLLDNEDKDGRFANEEAKTGMHGARSYFVNLHRENLNDAEHWMQNKFTSTWVHCCLVLQPWALMRCRLKALMLKC